MPLRSFYCVFRADMPDRFQPHPTPLLSFAEVFGAVAATQTPVLIARVRSEGNGGDSFDPNDRIESVIGLVDASVRFRTAHQIARSVVASLGRSEAGALGQRVLTLLTTHPAVLSDDQRRQAAEACQMMIQGGEGGGWAGVVLAGLVPMIWADDLLAAIPLHDWLRAPLGQVDEERRDERTVSVDTLSTTIISALAFERLCERLPGWLTHAFNEAPARDADDDQDAEPARDATEDRRPPVEDRSRMTEEERRADVRARLRGA